MIGPSVITSSAILAKKGGVTIQADGALLLFMARGALRQWRAGRMETVIESIPDEINTRFNDAIADPAGRVCCGTMPDGDGLGRLYRLDPNGRLVRLKVTPA